MSGDPPVATPRRAATEGPSPEGDGFGRHKHAQSTEADFRSRPDRRLSAAVLRRFRSLRDLLKASPKGEGFHPSPMGTLNAASRTPNIIQMGNVPLLVDGKMHQPVRQRHLRRHLHDAPLQMGGRSNAAAGADVESTVRQGRACRGKADPVEGRNEARNACDNGQRGAVAIRPESLSLPDQGSLAAPSCVSGFCCKPLYVGREKQG